MKIRRNPLTPIPSVSSSKPHFRILIPPIPLMAIWVSLFFFLLLKPGFSQLDDFIYNGFSLSNTNNSNMSLNGVAEIQKSGIIRLTNETSRLIGHAFYPFPLQFKNSSTNKVFSFSTSFAFSIVPEYPKLGGHGLAFTISPTKELRGALPSQYLGLLNASVIGNYSNHVFAIEFDTVQDFEFGDINDNHVGVDLDSLHSNFSKAAAYFTDDNTNTNNQTLNLKSGKMVQTWVDYDGVNSILNITLAPSSITKKPNSPLLSCQIDLSPILQNSMFVGFSASTGLLASSHYLFGWSFKMKGKARDLDVSKLPSLPNPHSGDKARAFTIGVSSSATILIFTSILLTIYLVRKIKNADPIEAWEYEYGPHRFSYRELSVATRGFSSKELLGFGGFGKVYKGVLPTSKIEVAVKRVSHESKQGLREFVAEIASIGRLRHRNLVQLQGWCRKRGDLLLVYDYMPNGSLDKFLFENSENQKPTLNWQERFIILRGVASGLLYLHEEWEQIVVHRDVKASNVLLDADLNGRLGDFGLARLYEHGTNPNTTHVVGTLGYLAPELTRTGKATKSTDVFAFGALLLEVACGRRPVEPKALPEELILVDWVWECWGHGNILQLVDPRLGSNYMKEEMEMVLKLGLMCSNPAPAARPSMRQVTQYLDGDVPLPEISCEAGPPVDYEMKAQCFDDFAHSYPSSSEKVSSCSFAVGIGGVSSSSLLSPRSVNGSV